MNTKNTLNEKELSRIYFELYNHSSVVDITWNDSLDALSKELSFLYNNAPELYYIEGFNLRKENNKISLIPSYIYTINECKIFNKQYNELLTLLLENIIDVCSYDKILKIHDIFLKNMKYSDIGPMSESHSILGPLLKKEGICEGFAKTLKLFCDRLDIPSYIIYGEAFDQLTQKWSPHAWNLVAIDGNWVHVDVTFDICLTENNNLHHDYFALSTKNIQKDHKYKQNDYPSANSDIFEYYIKNNLVLKSEEDIAQYCKKAISLGNNSCIFKVIESLSPEVVMETIQNTFSFKQYFKNKYNNINICCNKSLNVYEILLSKN